MEDTYFELLPQDLVKLLLLKLKFTPDVYNFVKGLNLNENESFRDLSIDMTSYFAEIPAETHLHKIYISWLNVYKSLLKFDKDKIDTNEILRFKECKVGGETLPKFDGDRSYTDGGSVPLNIVDDDIFLLLLFKFEMYEIIALNNGTRGSYHIHQLLTYLSWIIYHKGHSYEATLTGRTYITRYFIRFRSEYIYKITSKLKPFNNSSGYEKFIDDEGYLVWKQNPNGIILYCDTNIDDSEGCFLDESQIKRAIEKGYNVY